MADETEVAATPNTVRAKFGCTEVTPVDDGVKVKLQAVIGGDSEENDAFFKLTPSGSITLEVVSPTAGALFEKGKQYFVDFTPVVVETAEAPVASPEITPPPADEADKKEEDGAGAAE